MRFSGAHNSVTALRRLKEVKKLRRIVKLQFVTSLFYLKTLRRAPLERLKLRECSKKILLVNFQKKLNSKIKL